MERSKLSIVSVMLLCSVSACPEGGNGAEVGHDDHADAMDPQATAGDQSDGTDAASAGDPGSGSEDDGDGQCEPPSPDDDDRHDPGLYCDEEVTRCVEDQDRDGVHLTCDNAPRVYNPDQADMDKDSFGDIIDLCPTIQGTQNTADADGDGIGNACDTCPRAARTYDIDGLAIPPAMRVRANPRQTDSDGDGVGDVCDNCIVVPNCENYGNGPGQTPFRVGMPFDPEASCQDDDDQNMVGDACEGLTSPSAAGPVGFGDDDDFDQDGIRNFDDLCPRQPVARIPCRQNEDCPESSRCASSGVCNHSDWDGDGVGDVCDTCPFVANPLQITEGGMQLDDEDGDFIGAACEQAEACVTRANPRPFAFYDVSVNGFCCVTQHGGQPIEDPDGNPIDLERWSLPPGMLELPPGCDEALGRSCGETARRLGPRDVEDLADLWSYLCFLPAWDQDFDGVPDSCDLCPYVFDPEQEIYVDANDREWPTSGKYCNGEYHIDARCELPGGDDS